MNKLAALGLSTCAVASAALISTGVASSDPVAISPYNVVGEPYGRAVSILKNLGVKATFGGAVGSAVQQSQCIVNQQKQIPSGKMILMLNCTQEAVDSAETPTGPGTSRVGSNGVTTVTPTPVGPAPGMATPAAPAPPPPPA